MRLGFAVRAVSEPRLRRRGSSFSAQLIWLRDMLAHLERRQIGMYRIPSDLAPAQAAELREQSRVIAFLGSMIEQLGLRITVHAELYAALGSADAAIVARSSELLAIQARFLDQLGVSAEGVIVTHIGSAEGGEQLARERFLRSWERLPIAIQQRLVLEHDDQHGLAELGWIHERCGIPLVFDSLHQQLHNRAGITLSEALAIALASWPAELRPKIHLSTQRTEGHIVYGRGGALVMPPRHGQHADFINPFETRALLEAAGGQVDFDIMLEAKAGDLALLRLRSDLQHFAAGLLHEQPVAGHTQLQGVTQARGT